MFVNSDFSDLLRLFNGSGVRYLVVGGYAVVQYAEPRFTKDLDLWISTDPDNAEAVFRALRAFGAPLKGMTAGDFGEEGFFYQIGAPPVRVDIMMGLPGVAFEEAWVNRNIVAFDDLAVSFISREDLVRSKRATGRPQDLIDLDNLSGSTS
ncbi:MAG: DUF6036 family nucleotidyltransferase [Ardenticatenales bacterium]